METYSESFLYDYENIFKLSNRKYLLKYPIDEFLKRLNNREKNLTDILLNGHLNEIIIIVKNSIIFILIYGNNYKRKNDLYSEHFEFSERSQTKISIN